MKIKVAFSGSGSLAPIHAGAVTAFLDTGHQIVEVAGTSGGSIVASAVALGLTGDDLKKIVMADLPKGIASFQILALLKLGLNDGKILLSYLKSLFGDATFSDLAIPLTIMATDISNKKSFEFSKTNTPKVRLVDACRASSSVPFFYAPYLVNGVELVDGGCCNNIPVNRLTIDYIPRYGIDVVDGGNCSASSLIGLAKQTISTMLNANEDNLMAWGRETGATIVQVDANPYDFLNFDLTQDQKLDLFERGYDAVIGLFK